MDSTYEMVMTYRAEQKKFKKACRNVILLNNRIEDMKARYKRAVRDDRFSYRYTTRVHMAGVEGVRNAIYEYAASKADLLDNIRRELKQQGLYEDDSSDGNTSYGSDCWFLQFTIRGLHL